MLCPEAPVTVQKPCTAQLGSKAMLSSTGLSCLPECCERLTWALRSSVTQDELSAEGLRGNTSKQDLELGAGLRGRHRAAIPHGTAWGTLPRGCTVREGSKTHFFSFVRQMFIRNLLEASVPGFQGRVSAQQLGWKVDVKTKHGAPNVNLKPQVQVLLFPLNQEKL